MGGSVFGAAENAAEESANEARAAVKKAVSLFITVGGIQFQYLIRGYKFSADRLRLGETDSITE